MSYPSEYGKSYEDWVKEKAKRILEILEVYFNNKKAIDINHLVLHIYQERLRVVSFESFRAVEKYDSFRLLNKKPSPFIKGFIYYILERLSEDGYLKKQKWYEYVDEKGFLQSFPFQVPEEGMKLVDYFVQYYVERLPSFDYLVSIITWKDPTEIQYYVYKIAEKFIGAIVINLGEE